MLNFNALVRAGRSSARLLLRLESGRISEEEAVAELGRVARRAIDEAVPEQLKEELRGAVAKMRAHVERQLADDDTCEFCGDRREGGNTVLCERDGLSFCSTFCSMAHHKQARASRSRRGAP
jgi:hypothetical protein